MYDPAVQPKHKFSPLYMLICSVTACVMYGMLGLAWLLQFQPIGAAGFFIGAGGVALAALIREVIEATLDNRRLRVLYYIHTGKQP